MGQWRQVRYMPDQFAHFNLVIGVGLGKVFCWVGLGTHTCFGKEAGFFGANLEFGDGKGVVLPAN
ncbi:hypothetical protein PS619_02914 [Pseudomonas fluorescens]|nr:hypothetical protein PS619_02914 [Pseudomonas fluorescens]